MMYRLAADAVLVLHLGFILFVLFGALLCAWRPMAWLAHVPAALWGAVVELTGRSCPLTAWENLLRAKAGTAGYSQSFVEHYLLALIYPDGLTRQVQYALAALVVLVNLALYAWLWLRRRRRSRGASGPSGR